MVEYTRKMFPVLYMLNLLSGDNSHTADIL